MAHILILAAGLGTRMKSKRAKVLHELAGRPLICHVLRAALAPSPESVCIVVGHQAEEVERVVVDEISTIAQRSDLVVPRLTFVRQQDQRGTGHAVMAAREWLESIAGQVIVTAADGPMIRGETFQGLVASQLSEQTDATVLTTMVDNPIGYGRIIRNRDNRFERCVEQTDCTPEQAAIREIGVSIYCFEVEALLGALDQLTTDNAQAEYYLTDVPEVMVRQGRRVGLVIHSIPEEVLGINTRVELAEMERRIRDRKLRELMLSGVTIVDPATTYIHLDVEVGPDTVIAPQVIIEGQTTIGTECTIQSWTRLKNVHVGDRVTIRNCCVIEDSTISEGAGIGPFARLRAGAEIGEEAAIGNFVEVKKSKIGRKTKASHLSYLGDAILGERVNIGAGTVTCNYDGVRKNQTIIEDGVKIGSDTMLVAPVRVGRGSVTGAGAVVIKDVPPDTLVVGVPAVPKKRTR